MTEAPRFEVFLAAGTVEPELSGLRLGCRVLGPGLLVSRSMIAA